MYTHTHAHRARGGAWASGVCAGQRSCGARGCRGSGGWGGNCRAGCDGASDTGHGGCTVVSFVCVQVYCYETPNTGVYYDARHSCIQLSLILSHPTFSLSRARARSLSITHSLPNTHSHSLSLFLSLPPPPPSSLSGGWTRASIASAAHADNSNFRSRSPGNCTGCSFGSCRCDGG